MTSQFALEIIGTVFVLALGGYNLGLVWYAYFVYCPTEQKRKSIEAEKMAIELRLRKIASDDQSQPAAGSESKRAATPALRQSPALA
jgi:hypothetical protein